MIEALVLRHANLSTIFEVAYDASYIGIKGGLSQDSHSIAYFSGKRNKVEQHYYTYDAQRVCSLL